MYWLKQPIKDTHEKQIGATVVIFGMRNMPHVPTDETAIKDTHKKQPGATAVIFGLQNKLHVLTETAN